MIVDENNSMPYMKSLENCLNKIIKDGYSEDFTITEQGLETLKQGGNYQPEQIQIVNSYRFEGETGAADKAILYVIETNDGTKGTLVDSYGAYKESLVSQFMSNVEQKMKKKVVKH